MGTCFSADTGQSKAQSVPTTTAQTLSDPDSSSSDPELTTVPRWSSVDSTVSKTVKAEGRNSLLIECAAMGEHQRRALTQFHAQQHQGLYHLGSPEDMLSDVRLIEVIGAGGFAAVLRGYWRGSTDVAVKCFCTRPPAGASASELPARGLTEVLLARDLSHPHIIRTFDVRCCPLTKTFIDATRSTVLTGLRAGRRSSVTSLIDSYHGQTPLWPGQVLHAISDIGEAGHEVVELDSDSEVDEGCADIMASGDGFGNVAHSSKHAPISWSELLQRLGAQEGDLLQVIIMQHASFGTLWDAIRKSVFQSVSNTLSDKRRRYRALLRTAREIAQGLEHLHLCNLVHGDIKPANVLLQDSRADTRGFTALISDFGLSQSLLGEKHHSKHAHGTASYLAPELLLQGEVHKGVDIYAFGILLYEMVTGQTAYQGMRQAQVLMHVSSGGRPPTDCAPWTDAMYDQVKDLYVRCAAHKPMDRPTATQLVQVLSKLEDSAHREAVRQSREEIRRSQETNRQNTNSTLSSYEPAYHRATTLPSAQAPPALPAGSWQPAAHMFHKAATVQM